MKVLWVVNTIFPYPASKLGMVAPCFGGWAHSLYSGINKGKKIDFCIVATYTGKEQKKYVDKNTVYYLIPNKKENKYNSKLRKYWKIIIEDFNPDIVHIHGTEYPKALPLIEEYPSLNYIVSIQGFLTSYSRVYNSNLEFSILLKNLTVRDFFKPKTGYLTSIDYKNRAKYEKRIIESINNVIGRTDWDRAEVLAINPNIHYYQGEENLRKCFYEGKWDINKINRHTIFFSQAQSIIKGFYLMIEALKIIKVKYPDVKVIVAGNNILDTSTIKGRLKRQSYTKYLQKLINKYDLKNNIIFTGFLSAEQYKEKLISCNVFVQASSVENSSNSLGEAMILAVPCVASNVGGTATMLVDKQEGFLYPYTEPELLAYYVEKFFDDDDLCKKMGANASRHAVTRHAWDNNAKVTIETYEDIIRRNKQVNE